MNDVIAELVARLRASEDSGPMRHCVPWTQIDRDYAEAAAVIEAQATEIAALKMLVGDETMARIMADAVNEDAYEFAPLGSMKDALAAIAPMIRAREAKIWDDAIAAAIEGVQRKEVSPDAADQPDIDYNIAVINCVDAISAIPNPYGQSSTQTGTNVTTGQT